MAYEEAQSINVETEDIENLAFENHATTSSTSLLKKRWVIVAGFFVAAAFVGLVSHGQWGNQIGPTEHLDASIELATSDDDSWKKITCPVIGALFKNGDLLPDEDGYVTRGQTQKAMLRVGISEVLALSTTKANFGFLPTPQRINIFKMDMDMYDEDEEPNNREHDKSTGIRDGSAPDESKYDEFESQFIGDDDIWSKDDVKAAIKYYQRNTNDAGENANGLTSIKSMFNQFADDDATLSKAEFKGLFLNSDYPAQWKVKREAAIAKWEEQEAESESE